MSSEPERPTHGDDDVPSSRPSLSPPAPRPEDERAEASDLRPRWWQVATLVLVTGPRPSESEQNRPQLYAYGSDVNAGGFQGCAPCAGTRDRRPSI